MEEDGGVTLECGDFSLWKKVEEKEIRKEEASNAQKKG